MDKHTKPESYNYLISRRLLYNEIAPLWENLTNINYAVIKGEVLSQQIYNDPGKRHSCDIDILVDKRNLVFIEKELAKLGFNQVSRYDKTVAREQKLFALMNSHQTLPYQKVMLGFELNVDLNFDIFWGEYDGKRIDIDEFLKDTAAIDVFGKTMMTLSPPKTLIQLILHHYKDMNSIFLLLRRKRISHAAFVDIYRFIKNNSDNINFDTLYTVSTVYGIIPYVFYMLYYTSLFFSDNELATTAQAFLTAEGVALLNCYGLSNKERKEWNCNFETRIVQKDLTSFILPDLTRDDIKKLQLNDRFF